VKIVKNERDPPLFTGKLKMLKKHVAILGTDQLFADTDNTTLDHQEYTIFCELYDCTFISLHHQTYSNDYMQPCQSYFLNHGHNLGHFHLPFLEKVTPKQNRLVNLSRVETCDKGRLQWFHELMNYW
jgi:hypothetical protein